MWIVRAATMAVLLSISASPIFAEGNAITLLLSNTSQVRPLNVTVEAVRYGASEALEVRQTRPYRGFDSDTFAFVPGLDFHDGTIEVDVAGSLLPDAPPNARGFIGVAFRIDAEGGSFACEGFTFGRPTVAPKTKFAVTVQPSIFRIPATILTACVVKRRESMSLTPTSCLTNGLTCGSRYRARPPNSMSAPPRSQRSSCMI
jgi:hypothetical protein